MVDRFAGPWSGAQSGGWTWRTATRSHGPELAQKFRREQRMTAFAGPPVRAPAVRFAGLIVRNLDTGRPRRGAGGHNSNSVNLGPYEVERQKF